MGATEGVKEGNEEGASVGVFEGDVEGLNVGALEGDMVGSYVGTVVVGLNVGDSDGLYEEVAASNVHLVLTASVSSLEGSDTAQSFTDIDSVVAAATLLVQEDVLLYVLKLVRMALVGVPKSFTQESFK